ncbi:MAG: tetratricopeptide repeat protein, partial [Lentisphaerae bacterium]|nr:tetratricopeptide repeat protein [Lentisphaerota bacterium]
DQAFVSLRKVTADFPWSVYANEAYYYIGMCHFKLQRWVRAAEALKMVGTSVAPNQEDVLAEAGQRLFVKIGDEDLIVLSDSKEAFSVQVQAGGGDTESVDMGLFGKSGIDYMGSIETEPGEPKPGDGILQFKGSDKVTVTYQDRNTIEGKRDVNVLATVRMVSTAAAGFTDGAYREYIKGVFVDQPCFIRVRDLDADVSPGQDRLKVKLHTQYTEKREVDVEQRGVDLDAEAEVVKERASTEVTLVETEAHSGIFTGSEALALLSEDGETPATPATQGLLARKGDEIVLTYADTSHIGGSEVREVSYKATVLAGDIQDVKIEHRMVDSAELKARKDLIESKIFLKLGQIFKDVGLNRQASDKAEEGLDRANRVIKTGLQAGLDREIVEQAFNVKWDLLMVQDKLGEAIGVCNTLIKMFPDSTLVDSALMRIAKAKLDAGEKRERREAVNILNGILRLQKSDLKPEAQFMMAEITQQEAEEGAAGRWEPDLSRALLEYKRCADLYPESPFAGESLERIANYYVTARDYARAMELIEQVFQDYPDASFLDEMLLKWAIVAYRQDNLQLAQQKMMQLLSEYPGSKAAAKAEKLLVAVNKKMQ